MEAMEVYKKLSQPPVSALRQIQAGDLKGKTDINPQWRYEAMTEAFGLVGIGWKYEIQKLWTEPGAKQGTILLTLLPSFIKLDVVAMKDLPPSDHCAPRTKSTCPPVALCCLHPRQSDAA